MSDQPTEAARRVARAEDEYAYLGCEVRRTEVCTVVTTEICPDMWDSNHVREINLPVGADCTEFVLEMEKQFRRLGREHCKFELDFRTSLQELAVVLRDRDYTPLPVVLQLFAGDEARPAKGRSARRAGEEVRPVEVDSDGRAKEDWRQIKRDEYGGAQVRGRFVERAIALCEHKMSVARIRHGQGWDGGLLVHVAYIGATPAGCVELFWHGGVAKIEGLYVKEKMRGRGIGSHLTLEMVNLARQKGCDIVYLAANAFDSPRYMYLNLGFKDLTERAGWLTTWGSLKQVEDSVRWD
ncbi:MAG: GNAT family N-acetyltransferase [Firmicutes bacterium]|jgi:GNAT superfamily N-acetyltransferase|nr:GNAT family N-acetyltransferase [Bacillota bacterium]